MLEGIVGITLNKTILIVENDHNLRVFMRSVLEEEKHFVMSVTNGADALSILTKTSTPSLIILGTRLPLMNADLFLNTLKSQNEFSRIPVAQLLEEGESLLPGLCHYLKIPFEKKDLLEIVKICTSNA